MATAIALLLLDASLTFENLWPTPAVRWTGEISVDLALAVLALAAIKRWRGRLSPLALECLSAVWILLVVGRYAEVTAPALYGREVNLYWDLRFMPDVAAMIARVAPLWLLVAAIAAVLLAIVLLHRLLRWSFGRLARAMDDDGERRALVLVCAAAVILFAVQRVSGLDRLRPRVASPVTATYARQMALVLHARSGSTAVPASPPMDSTFADLGGADVFLVFVESYGAVSDEPRLSSRLAASRAALAADIRDSGRDVASAYVESPTFGGSSWLAHLSLISGIEVRDPDRNALLMMQPRDTLVKAFGRHGYRTIGLMPGLRQPWPEGTFYGFDEIYGARQLAYRGPEFGWFAP